jgi:hypothetical protein
MASASLRTSLTCSAASLRASHVSSAMASADGFSGISGSAGRSRLDATVLANLAALTLYELRHAARAGLRAVQRQACLLHGFLVHTGLQIQLRT